MVTTFKHGVFVEEISTGALPVRTVNTAIIGLIGTAPLADVTKFPVDTPVLVTNRAEAALLGATGTLKNALNGIWDQKGAAVVVIRVTEGTNTNATITNLIGGVDSGTGQYKGIQAFLKAEQATGYRPRILIAPGFTHQRLTGGVLSIAVTNGGSGYSATNPPSVSLVAPPSGGIQATAKAVVNDAGVVTAVQVDDNGAGYSTAPAVTFSGGGGTGAAATSTIGTVRNPVVAELLTIAERLLSVVVIDGPNTNDVGAVQLKTDWGSRRLYAVDPWITYFRDGNYVNEPTSAVVSGLIAKSDNERGFWWSPSNQQINGIVGVSRDVDFVLGDTQSRASLLNENKIATIIKNNGFLLWGNLSLSNRTEDQFFAVGRVADTIADSIKAASMPFVDAPVTNGLLTQILDTVDQYLRDLKNQGAITGGKVWYDPALNTGTQLALGNVVFSYDFGPAYPCQVLTYLYSINNGYAGELAA